jgi:UDP-N-acetylglucosamine--N-acetylmuramyl-(pentapeptide) pyrophosphoryl-undecaprenol N-acetylglucosamine transferase
MNRQPTLRVVVMAGGTGGHVFPALAVADELRARGVEVSWLGTREGLEAEVVPRAGYPIDYIRVQGLRGKGLWGWLQAPFKLLRALAQGWAVMRRLHPAAVLGMGGFVSGPGGLAAWLLRRPLLIHEQNARAGLTNRLLKPLAACVMEAFPNTFRTNAKKILHTGNPLREAFVEVHLQAAQEDDTHGDPLRLLVVGGSLGAMHFNQVVPQALAAMAQGQRPQIWHQAGKQNLQATRAAYQAAGVEARIEPFIDDMLQAYQWADVVLCRAGAMTISELAAVGVASILVPYPHAVDDHQTANAHYLADHQAAVLLPQSQMTAPGLAQLLSDLTPEVLRNMATAARRLALPEATNVVAEQCLAVVRGEARGVAHG